MIEKLYQLLCSTYGLYLNTQSAHWNVDGPHFITLHKLFGKQYKEIAESIDTLAELIVMRKSKIKISFFSLQEFSVINSVPDEEEDWITLTQNLLNNHKSLVNLIEACIKAAEEASDEVILDFLINQLKFHQNEIWILKSVLK